MRPVRRVDRVAEGAPLLREYGLYLPSRVRIPHSPPVTIFYNIFNLKLILKIMFDKERKTAYNLPPQRAHSSAG
jgi:hypothetical protein